MRKVMEHIQELQKQASDACLLRVSTHTVGIINSIRTVGFDPITRRRGDGEEMGTGCAGRWGEHHFVLTAGHVLHSDARPSDLRIFWRPSGGIERIADADLRPQDLAFHLGVIPGEECEGIQISANRQAIKVVPLRPLERQARILDAID
jgi:hypothetical protein